MSLFNFLITQPPVSFDKESIQKNIIDRINREYPDIYILYNFEKADFVVIMNILPTILTKRGALHPVEAPVKTHVQLVFAIKVLPQGVRFPETEEEEDFTNNLKKWCKRLIIADNAGAVVDAIGGCLNEIGLA